jgi:hypothetical protein
MNYESFLETKKLKLNSVGIKIDESKINKLLFDFQRDIVVWSLKKGKACIFAGTGIGSECFVAVKNGRHAVGIELKESYYKQSVLNMIEADRLSKAPKQITFADVKDKELIE